MNRLEEYIPIVGEATLEELRQLANRLHGKTIQNINSTAVGGGVAEILTRMIPLLNQLGVEAVWDVIKGDEKFFATTKKFHNGLHGVAVDIAADGLTGFLAPGTTRQMTATFHDAQGGTVDCTGRVRWYAVNPVGTVVATVDPLTGVVTMPTARNVHRTIANACLKPTSPA